MFILYPNSWLLTVIDSACDSTRLGYQWESQRQNIFPQQLFEWQLIHVFIFIFQPSQCFNLRVGDDLSVTCAAETSEIRDQWVEGFRRLLGNRLEHYKAQYPLFALIVLDQLNLTNQPLILLRIFYFIIFCLKSQSSIPRTVGFMESKYVTEQPTLQE